MCLSFCHRRRVIFHNHEDCPLNCPHVWEVHGTCEDCVHRLDDVCGLTRSPLPSRGGCCHFDADILQGGQWVSTRHLFAIPVWMGEGIREVLASFGATYQEESSDGDVVLIDLDQLALPYTYGIGTEPELDGGLGC